MKFFGAVDKLKEDLDGLAALIELCDLVVSTSNVTIHMAGALGKDSWVLPFAANFWWLIEHRWLVSDCEIIPPKIIRIGQGFRINNIRFKSEV